MCYLPESDSEKIILLFRSDSKQVNNHSVEICLKNVHDSLESPS